ncbi:MAG: rod shape-determining protein RodA [Gammaproteobacteria bacterium]|nr:MAG: rod shape-determining protein RodA [Gammaproteobacteria bacterium]
MFTAITIVSFMGLVILYSAGKHSPSIVTRQILSLLFAYFVMLVVAQFPISSLKRWTPWIFLTGTALLICVLLFGRISNGAQRWIDLKLFRFQPSEIMKIAVPMMVSWFFSRIKLPPGFLSVITSIIIIIIPTILIAKQPDLGTSLLIASSGFFVIYFAGISWLYILAGALLSLPAGYIMWNFIMHDYQKRRVLTLIDPHLDPHNAGYHINQSEIAIGSGGIFGKGWLNGTQSQLDFLPERSTDFIFSAFSEEFGFVGIVLLLIFYYFIIVRGLYIATQAQDTYSRLLAGSIALTFFVYIFVNIGMVSGLLPVVGLPLPLISRGGTSIVTIMATFGILMSIHTHRRLYSS